jgi:hypothetical protein
MEFLIYLDVCCLNRPFDDQTQERIRLEAEAILFILTKFQVGDWQLLGSEAFDDELNNTAEGARKRQMIIWAGLKAMMHYIFLVLKQKVLMFCSRLMTECYV